MTTAPEYTREFLFKGRLQCLQPRTGYRYSLDSILLANLAAIEPDERILEIGAGCGIISLILAYRWPGIRITALEIQTDLAELCRRNARINSLDSRVETIVGDLRVINALLPAENYTSVLANPPYTPKNAGRINQDPQSAMARHELTTDMEFLVAAAWYVLMPGGKVSFIYPAARSAELLKTFSAQGFAPRKIRFICTYPGAEASLVIVEAVKGGVERLQDIPSFYVYKKLGGEYSSEMTACYEP